MKVPRTSSVLLALSLLGCGGGGGGTSVTAVPITQTPAVVPPAPTPTPTPAQIEAFRTPEYKLMGALDAIHAAEAYALGYTGAGVVIGIVDFNFDFASSQVRFHPASAGPDPTAVALYEAQLHTTTDTTPHGHAVAVTAAGVKDNIGVHGIAFDSQVLAVDYFSRVNERIVKQGGATIHVSDPWTYLTSRGVRIVNTSYGYEAGDPGFSFLPAGEYYVTESSAQAVINGALLVASAGNAHHADPSLSNFDIIDDLRDAGRLDSGPGAFIIAGAVDSNNQITSFSNRAGTLANYFMVAPGDRLTLPWTGGALFFLSGTSFSAPLVSGAAAIIMQRWPTLTARQVMQILFDSATDLGAPGTDTIYGHGLLNVAAALQPNGVTTFALPDGATPIAQGSALALATPFGDAPAFRAALASVAVFDTYGRDYRIDLSQGITPARGPDLVSAMNQALGWHGTGFHVGPSTDFTFQMRDNPEDGLVNLSAHGGPENHFSHPAIFRFAGAAGGMNWTAGSGLALHDAMVPNVSDPFAGVSLSQAFSPGVASAPGGFASLSFDLANETRLSFGIAQSQDLGLIDRPHGSLKNSAQTAALRLDTREADVDLGFEFGINVEKDGLLGTMAGGALTMADNAATAWTSVSAQAEIFPHWSLKGAFTTAETAAQSPHGSLIASIGPVIATSFSFGLAREHLFDEGDALSFLVSQPLRAERASLVLNSAYARDAATGDLLFTRQETSLVPSGREITFESAYRFPLGEWRGSANVSYSLDAGHQKDARAIAALIWIARNF